jgi:hypothetical protein
MSPASQAQGREARGAQAPGIEMWLSGWIDCCASIMVMA